MDIKALIEKARKNGKTAFDESTSKQMLKTYGVPVVSETVAATVDDAVRAAARIGYPVVLKGLGETLQHKTELGLVKLNLEGKEAVGHAAELISKRAGDKLEGFLVQPQVEGQREFVAGLFRDAQFGAVVMFGLGGIFTEALADVAFRLAPIDDHDAERMLAEIQSKSLLQGLRGDAKANPALLARTLTGLSRIGVDHPEIAEIDINPLIITPKGDACAVDAMIVLAEHREEQTPASPAASGFLEHFFHPRSIAFVGASSTMGKWGHLVFVQTKSGGFDGEIYLVNQKNKGIAGRKVYASVGEIPGTVDLAVVTVPAAKVLELIPQFKTKGIKSMLLITAGFGETGPDGKKLEKELIKKAREAGIWVIGPNTMGVCNPHNKLYCMGSGARPAPGSTAVVAQSGQMGVQILAFAEQQGIGIRGYCGSGNEAMIAIEDYIEAFGADPLTRNIMLYVESIKNGRRFFENAHRVSQKKPIVLLKGGQSNVGSKAAASHTGALTTDSRIFDAVCKQAGIVKVDHTMDMLDLAASFSSLPLPCGNNVGIMTLGGGWGVVTADYCSAYNLNVPDLSEGLKNIFDKILPPFWSKSNPVDIVAERDLTVPIAIIENLLKWDQCDAVIHLGILGRKFFVSRLTEFIKQADPTYTEDYLASVKNNVIEFEKTYVGQIVKLMETYEKPVIGVHLVSDEASKAVYALPGCRFNSVFFPSPERAVKAIASMYAYRRFLGQAAGVK